MQNKNIEATIFNFLNNKLFSFGVVDILYSTIARILYAVKLWNYVLQQNRHHHSKVNKYVMRNDSNM